MMVHQNQMAEFTLHASEKLASPYAGQRLEAQWTAPDGSTGTVRGFWAGGDCWKIRYSAPVTGIHTLRTRSLRPDQGLDGQTLQVEVAAYTGDNPLYQHGGVCRKGDERFLRHQDGTPFFWLADTWWMGLTTRLAFPEDFHTMAQDRRDKGFTVIQIVAGLYPDMLPFDERGKNEGGFPWNRDFTEINPAYFDAADRKILSLVEHGLCPCIVGSWGFFMKFAGKEALKRHWDYLIARWAALPVIWCAAGEANMTFYDEQISMEEHLKRSRRDWNDMVRYIRERDPFHRLVTIHPTAYGHEQVEDDGLLDLDMLQTGHGGVPSLAPTMQMVQKAVSRKKLPVIDSEVCYEGICGSSYEDVQRYAFLSCLFLGACGHTYGANGIWQLNDKDCPYGVSPHGAQWGDTPWQQAYQLPGSRQIGLIKRYWTSFDWWRFEPHPEWIERPCSLNALDGHFAMGIPGEVRLFFKPHFGGDFWGEVLLKGIEPDIRYRAERMNPITGQVTDLGLVTPDAQGNFRMPRIDAFQDWIYALIRVQ